MMFRSNQLTSAALAVVLFLLPAVTCTAASVTPNLRTVTAESSCNAASNEQACYSAQDDATASPCQWCVAGAIPSECMSQEQAADLPAGVFECSAPGDAFFSFLEGKRHSLSLKEHPAAATAADADDGQEEDGFCDSSSKSISGYMDIKGSSVSFFCII
jgi:hypothetical protein